MYRGALTSRRERIATTISATISMTTNVAIDRSSTRNRNWLGSGASVHCCCGRSVKSKDANTIVIKVIQALLSKRHGDLCESAIPDTMYLYLYFV